MALLLDPQEVTFDSMQVLYDAAFLSECSAELFRPQITRGVKDVHGKAMGRGDALFFSHQEHPLVLRHFRRGGFIRHLVADRYPGIRAEASRSYREWRLLADLYARGLPVPRPVAASFCPAGLFYRADLITHQLENVRPLSMLLTASAQDELWGKLGETLRRFHDAQVYHADLNAHNILIDQHQQAWLIDFDRGSIKAGQQWKRANLQRLLRSLHKLTAGSTAAGQIDASWRCLLNGYGPAAIAG